ncbi:MAG: FprA family A-type flavoprotein [Candidatus Bathyarchaeota archaeon]|nr:FprA family A-type flavoprotein [Candidatus Bathyarchaeota archaeon]MCX8177872.1 FprA family A-type flavoprotein [Candidatus Bathyarchaeota archaeon]MDW8193591.1 FprA family A-type flavoprotein [Nitrososphaerota archaeon]
MNRKNVVKLADGVYWISIRDWNRRLFDALISLPNGTSYNAYLVTGGSLNALIDTVNPGFEGDLQAKIHAVTNPEDIGYVIMNHAEPDHAGAIPYIMKIASDAKLVTTSRGVKLAQTFYGVPQERIKTVADGETLSLGGKTLRFIEAPMLHWPETMFTYVEEDGILFPCDFFGSHLAMGVYSDEVEDLLVHAQRYWGEIMMPFRAMAQKALEKLKPLNIRVIAPSHGPVHRNPKIILDAYRRWANGETRPKATIMYVSMWGSTESMMDQLAETLASEGVELAIHNLALSDVGDIAKDLVDSRAIALGAPTVLGGAHPLAVYAAYLVKVLRPPAKFAVLLSSYGWGAAAIKQIQEVLGQQNIEVVGALEVNGPPAEEAEKRVAELGKMLSKKILEVS